MRTNCLDDRIFGAVSLGIVIARLRRVRSSSTSPTFRSRSRSSRAGERSLPGERNVGRALVIIVVIIALIVIGVVAVVRSISRRRR